MGIQPSITIFGWLNADGSITTNREEIINNVRKEIQSWKNSDKFMEQIDNKYPIILKSDLIKD